MTNFLLSRIVSIISKVLYENSCVVNWRTIIELKWVYSLSPQEGLRNYNSYTFQIRARLSCYTDEGQQLYFRIHSFSGRDKPY